MEKKSVSLWIISGLLVALTSVGGCLKGEQGPMGPPGLLIPGTVEGKVKLWKDYYNLEEEAAGVEISLETSLEDLGELPECRDTTEVDGTYSIEDIPAGIYTMVAQKEGYGTMKQYSFSVGGGTSYFSPDICRVAKAPASVTAEQGTIEIDSELIPAIEVSWVPADTTLWNRYWIYYSTEVSFEDATFIGQVVTSSPSGIFIYNLSAGEYYFGICADNGLYYVDETSGEVVFPTVSDLARTAESILVTETAGEGKKAKMLIPPLAQR
ncbi:MAG: carboxypeptidase regulatory-like domain-containing protein [Candidatus Latescibacteria bacterium]|nr:carboxypeptidase regulatory-like domain-containing protein [Candidatus Latescibacterota bacterium]